MMKKFTYRGTEIIGALIEETNTHYIVSIEGGQDQLSLSKEVTTIEETDVTDTSIVLAPYEKLVYENNTPYAEWRATSSGKPHKAGKLHLRRCLA